MLREKESVHTLIKSAQWSSPFSLGDHGFHNNIFSDIHLGITINSRSNIMLTHKLVEIDEAVVLNCLELLLRVVVRIIHIVGCFLLKVTLRYLRLLELRLHLTLILEGLLLLLLLLVVGDLHISGVDIHGHLV